MRERPTRPESPFARGPVGPPRGVRAAEEERLPEPAPEPYAPPIRKWVVQIGIAAAVAVIIWKVGFSGERWVTSSAPRTPIYSSVEWLHFEIVLSSRLSERWAAAFRLVNYSREVGDMEKMNDAKKELAKIEKEQKAVNFADPKEWLACSVHPNTAVKVGRHVSGPPDKLDNGQDATFKGIEVTVLEGPEKGCTGVTWEMMVVKK